MSMHERKVEAKLKRVFTLSVKTNPSTGYSWDLEFDKTMLCLEGEGSRSSQAIGAGGTERIRFLPIKEGSSRVCLRLKRPWEEEEVQTRTYLINTGA